MPDIRLREAPQQKLGFIVPAEIDWVINSDGIDETQALATAIMVALGTDRLAAVDDVLPDNYSNDKRGWWGDIDATDIWNGWTIGTRLWLMQRDKITGAGYKRGSTAVKASTFIHEALQPFVDQLIIASFTVDVVQISSQRVDATIVLYRRIGPAISLQYAILADSLIAGM